MLASSDRMSDGDLAGTGMDLGITSQPNGNGNKTPVRSADQRLRGPAPGVGTMTCDSETSGVTCTDTSTGHFFRVSRESYQLG